MNCRLCGQEYPTEFLTLGNRPLANKYLTAEQFKLKTFPARNVLLPATRVFSLERLSQLQVYTTGVPLNNPKDTLEIRRAIRYLLI
jgi:hypothetical protein